MLVKNRGGVVWDLPDMEALRRIEHDGFTKIVTRKPVIKTIIKSNDELLSISKQYEEKFQKSVPTNMKNNIEWIKSKL